MKAGKTPLSRASKPEPRVYLASLKSLSKLRSKTLDNFRNRSCAQIQQKADWFTEYWNTTIGERYKRGDLHIHAHIRGLSEFCAIFQYTEMPPNEGIPLLSPISGTKSTRSDSCNLDNPMLVRIIYLFEPKEGAIASTPFGQIYGFEERTTAALVWLQPLDTCLMFRSEQLNSLFPFSFEVPFIQENRELEQFIPCNCFTFVRTVQEGKLIDEMIKRRAKVVGNLANINTPIKRRWEAVYSDAIDMLTRYRILLCPDNTIMGVFEKGILHRPESVNFTFCSFNLEAYAIERMHMLYTSIIHSRQHIV